MAKKGYYKELVTYVSENKPTFAVYVVLRVIVLSIIVFSIIRGDAGGALAGILAFVLFLVPAFLEKKLKIELPSVLEIIVLLFIFASQILGEIAAFYVKVPFWDTMLHTINGFLFAAIGFALMDILNRNEKIKFNLSPLYAAIVAFCFSMTIGVLWEFFEFSMDIFFGMDMQKDTVLSAFGSVTLDPTHTNTVIRITDIKEVAVNGESLGLGGYLDIGLYDTMKDLFVNFIGALVFSIIGFFYIKTRGKGKIAKLFIPKLRKEIPSKKTEREA